MKNLKDYSKQLAQTKNLIATIRGETSNQIISYLQKAGEKSVTEIWKKLQLEQSVVSLTLGNLLEIGVVTKRREARYMYYSCNEARLKEIMEMIVDLNELAYNTK